MNKHWTVKLGDVADVNPRAPGGLGDDEAVAFVPMAGVSENGKLESHGTRVYRDVKKGYSYFERGDVLVAKITPCFENGKAALTDTLVEQVGFGSTEFHVLRPGPELDARYLFYALWNERFRAVGTKGMTGSAGQKRVPADLLRRTELRLPSLNEQRRIATILDKADALRQKRKRAIALLDSLTQSIFLEMFGDLEWTACRFEHLLERPLRNGLSPSTGGTIEAQVLTLSAVTGDEFKSASKKVAKFKQSPPSDQRVDMRDFLICRGNGNKTLVGVGKFPTIDMPDTAFPDTIIGARIDKSKVEPAYVERVWQSNVVREQIEAGARTTNGTFKVNQQILEAVTVPVPPRTLQAEFARRSATLQSQRKAMSGSLGIFDLAFHSLQHRAFSGQL